jgi:hypothetical protein
MRLIFALALLALFGCMAQTTPLGDIKNNPGKYEGQQVTVRGNITDSLKIGSLSGFRITDGNATLAVRSDTLPPVGADVTVKGTVVRDSIFGYYVLASGVEWKK